MILQRPFQRASTFRQSASSKTQMLALSHLFHLFRLLSRVRRACFVYVAYRPIGQIPRYLVARDDFEAEKRPADVH
jgi:hypothetical protein